MFWVKNWAQAAVKSCIIQEYEMDFCKIKNMGLAFSPWKYKNLQIGIQAWIPSS